MIREAEDLIILEEMAGLSTRKTLLLFGPNCYHGPRMGELWTKNSCEQPPVSRSLERMA
jgi:hypothetical protein